MEDSGRRKDKCRSNQGGRKRAAGRIQQPSDDSPQPRGIHAELIYIFPNGAQGKLLKSMIVSPGHAKRIWRALGEKSRGTSRSLAPSRRRRKAATPRPTWVSCNRSAGAAGRQTRRNADVASRPARPC